jgi:hypothetical protein
MIVRSYDMHRISVRADLDDGVTVQLRKRALQVIRPAVTERRIAMAWHDIPVFIRERGLANGD